MICGEKGHYFGIVVSCVSRTALINITFLLQLQYIAILMSMMSERTITIMNPLMLTINFFKVTVIIHIFQFVLLMRC